VCCLVTQLFVCFKLSCPVSFICISSLPCLCCVSFALVNCMCTRCINIVIVTFMYERNFTDSYLENSLRDLIQIWMCDLPFLETM